MSQLSEKELKAMREKPQKVINILDTDFDFKWDGIDYTLEKWETTTYPYYLAEHCALHMGRKYAQIKGLDFVKEAGKIVDQIMWKEFIEYNTLTLKQAQELAKKRKISIEDELWNPKKKDKLIEELKLSH